MKSIKKIIPLMLVLAIVFQPALSKADSKLGFEDKVKAYYTIEQDYSQELLNYNENKPLAIASLTKIMTYVLVMEDINANKYKLDDKIKIQTQYAKPEASTMQLKKGEELTVNDLIRGMMIVSGNDAADELAVKSEGSVEKFVQRMNKKAAELELESAKFYSASGYPENDKENMMSAKDLAKLTTYTINNYPQVLNYTKTQKLSMPTRKYEAATTVPFLGKIEGVDGFKTGTTEKAGYCLITTMSLKPNNPKNKIVSVLMGAPTKYDRNTYQKIILEYVRNSFEPMNILNSEKPIETKSVNSVVDKNVEIYPTEDVSILYNTKTGLQQKVDIKKDLKAPLKKGQIVGKVVIDTGKGDKREVSLVVKKPYEKADTLTRIKRSAKYTYELLEALLAS